MKSGIRILRMSPIGFQPIASASKALKLIGWKPMPPVTTTCLKNAAQKDRRMAGEVRGSGNLVRENKGHEAERQKRPRKQY